jgi:hypothetical protein
MSLKFVRRETAPRAWPALLCLLMIPCFTNCGAYDPDQNVSVTLSPYQVTLAPGQQKRFVAEETVSRRSTQQIVVTQDVKLFVWTVAPGGGSLEPESSTDTSYLYTAPSVPGTYKVTVVSKRDPLQSASSTVIVQ